MNSKEIDENSSTFRLYDCKEENSSVFSLKGRTLLLKVFYFNGDNSFGIYAKFPEKLTFLTSWCANVSVRIGNLGFLEIFCVRTEWMISYYNDLVFDKTWLLQALHAHITQNTVAVITWNAYVQNQIPIGENMAHSKGSIVGSRKALSSPPF